MITFFVLSRDAPGVEDLRDDRALLEEHWSYMDRFADTMIARGPTLRADRDTPTGSLHVLGLPDVATAEAFVADEPNHRAGVYAEHRVLRFEDLLGRTMWESPAARDGQPKFLVIAATPPAPLPADRLLLHGTLTGEDGEPAGTAFALSARDRAEVDELLAGVDAEVLDWEMGGRR